MAPTTGDDSPNDARQIVASYLAAFAGRNPGEIAAFVAPDFVNEHTTTLASGCVGRDAYLERLPSFLADMIDLRYEAEQLVAEGDTVAAFYTLTARWQGESPIRIRGVQRLEVHDGLITHRTDYWDGQTFLDQVGDD